MASKKITLTISHEMYQKLRQEAKARGVALNCHLKNCLNNTPIVANAQPLVAAMQKLLTLCTSCNKRKEVEGICQSCVSSLAKLTRQKN